MGVMGGGGAFDAADVVNSVGETLVGFYLVQGKVYNGGGHVGHAPQGGGGVLHMECTQLIVPHLGDMDDLYGRGFLAGGSQETLGRRSGVQAAGYGAVHGCVRAVYRGG